ncbi:DUF418 domain-containing protein [Thalassobacillus hwangdonensis]|uniref:DUF418 domain-containing protein n=1 Tax=Thalassobacillus hwangdonensis TaxID=546108 RepID=A0ABW3KWA5_9BACI
MRDYGTPLREANRLSWIDAARGLAILGIFMVNVPAFNAPYFLYGGEDVYWSEPLDSWVQAIVDIFFQASFYTLFSFLFGFGLQVMKDRLEQKGLTHRLILFRRLVVLIGFGMIHAFLIWHGDILLSYGTIGLLLFLFFNRKAKTLLIWAFGLLTVYTAMFTMLLYSIRDQLDGWMNYPAITAAKQNYGDGSLLEIWKQNYNDWIYANGPENWPFLIMSLLPMFLLGMYTARKKWLHQPLEHRKTLSIALVISFVLFILLKAGPYAFGNPAWVQVLQDNIGGSASAIFYVVGLTLLSTRKAGTKLLSPLTHVGRMSLSNYILQSLISFLLFYSVGFGLYGNVSPLESALIVIVLFTGQIFLSKWWIAKYRFGPLEWLWRTLTYGKKQPLRRKSET